MQPEAQAALRRVWLNQEKARYQQLSQTRPDEMGIWRKLGSICWELGEAEQASIAFDRALELQPGDPSLLSDYATACLASNRFEPALVAAERALAIRPDDCDGLLLRSDALRLLGRLDEALAAYERVLDLPGLSLSQCLHALSYQAVLLVWRQAYELARAAVERALRLAPEDPQLMLLRSSIFVQLRLWEEALPGLEQAARIPELSLSALANKARALAALGRFDDADAILGDLQDRYPHRQIEALFEPWRLPEETFPDSLPKRYTARGLYLIGFFDAQARCDWTERERVLADIESFTADALRYGFVAGIEPFRLLALPISPALQLSVARAQAAAVAARMAPIRDRLKIEWPPVPGDGRLRIGYVSGDFREHPTAHLTRKLFGIHDRSRFEIVGFSLRPDDGSRYRRDIVAGCDRFVELTGLSHAEAALRIAREGIHVLVDLHGYTRFARPELFALRPAPVQVAFLGYPGTSGAEYIPYIIADQTVLPETLRPWFTERPVYLPDCYQVNDDEQPIAANVSTRASEGLPEGAFVYCCFSSPYKIEPTVFTAWMRILRKVPEGVLWLLEGVPGCADHLRKAARERGIDPARLFFAPRLPKAEHLRRHRLADLYLDTFVVNAHTTASDALWAGLPILTLPGTTFQSRVCASLLTALGLMELVADHGEAYESLAVALAREPSRLRALREALAVRRLDSPPFTTVRFARQLERAFVVLWEASVAGESPDLVRIQR